MIGDLEKTDDKKRLKSKPIIEVVLNPSESESSTLAAKPTIDNIHDHSENKKDTTTTNNILYEPG